MNDELKQIIHEAVRSATIRALEGVDVDSRPATHVYQHALEAAKSGATEGLMSYCNYNQSLAAEVGGLNRATLRVNLRRQKGI